MASSSSSGMGSRSRRPQVFINFRGEELRRGFVGFLEPALKNEFINVFIDELELRGKDLKNLFVRIEESKIALVIFSKDYANSEWCLDELAKIKECMDLGNLDAIPIFYKIEPTVVKHLRGYFGKSFMNVKSRFKDDLERTQKWEDALVSVAQKFGLSFPESSDRTEREFIQSIVVEVKRVLNNIGENSNLQISQPEQAIYNLYPNLHIQSLINMLREAAIEVARAEAWGLNNPSRTSIVAQEWYNPHQGQENQEEAIYISSENDNHHEHTNNIEYKNVARIGSRGEQSYPVCSEEIEEESWSLDSEHVMKINGELPSEDEQIYDYERLFQRLELYDLVENKIQRDGNCQFRSLSDQLYRTPDHHNFVRKQVVHQLKSNPEMYEGYVPMAYTDYLTTMNRNGEWGDHVTLQAAADCFGVRMFVITSLKDTCYIEIFPHLQKSNRRICLSLCDEVHYNSIYPKLELPIPESKKKEKKNKFTKSPTFLMEK